MPHKTLRTQIIEIISNFIRREEIPVTSMRVAGSMAYADRRKITEFSDIDLDIFLDFSDLKKLNPLLNLLKCEFKFGDDSEQFAQLDIISNYGNYDGVEINLWLINTSTVNEINALEQKTFIDYFSLNKSENPLKFYKFYMSTDSIELDREFISFNKGFRSKRHFLYGSRLLSENYIINNLFKAYPVIGTDFAQQVKEDMWKNFIRKYPNTTVEDIIDYMPDKVQPKLSEVFKQQLSNSLIYYKSEYLN